MRRIVGTVTCSQDRKIEEGSIVTVSVDDVSLACGRSLTVGKQELNNVTEFPFKFDFEFNDGKVDPRYYGEFALTVNIEKDEKLTFVNDTRFSLIEHDGETKKIKDSIDVFVIPIN